jgi:hypothetical protein
MTRAFARTFSRVLLLAAIPALLSLAWYTPVGAQTLDQRCSNPELGYRVAFPGGWYVNQRVEGGELEDVAACRFFSPSDFEVRPQTEIAGVAVAIDTEASRPEGGTPTTVDGKTAFVMETETAEDGFEPAGTRHYSYWIELGPDRWLVAGTSDAANFVGDYDENRAVLDAMMDSLEFVEPQMPDTALPMP